MSRGRRHHPLWSRRRVLVTPQGSAVTHAVRASYLDPNDDAGQPGTVVRADDDAVATLASRRLRRTNLPRDRASTVKSP